MNEMKPEDVMRALEYCTTNGLCTDDCPLFEHRKMNLCGLILNKNALALLREKDATIADYILQIAEMQKQIATQDRILTDFMKRKQIEADKDAEIERLTVKMNAFGLTVKNLAEENERLTAQIEHCDACDRIGLTHSEHKVCIKQARAEAITEFADKLKTFYNRLPGKTVGGSVEYHIDQIAKEMREKQ